MPTESGEVAPQERVMSFEEILRERGCFVYTNVGTSMMPLLRQRRDIIWITVDYSELYRRPFQSVGPAFQASAPITGTGTLYGQPAPIS